MDAATKKVAHEAAEATGEFIGNKIAGKIEKPKPVLDLISRNAKKIITPSEKRGEILSKLWQILKIRTL